MPNFGYPCVKIPNFDWTRIHSQMAKKQTQLYIDYKHQVSIVNVKSTPTCNFTSELNTKAQVMEDLFFNMALHLCGFHPQILLIFVECTRQILLVIVTTNLYTISQ